LHFIDYTDTAEFWIRGYDVDDFRPRIEHLWNQIKPLYLQIHAYVRRKLWELYGSSVITRRGPIPAHLLGKFNPIKCCLRIISFIKFHICLLGDMWAQSWERLDDFTRPYPTIDDVNPTSAMINQVINTFLMYLI